MVAQMDTELVNNLDPGPIFDLSSQLLHDEIALMEHTPCADRRMRLAANNLCSEPRSVSGRYVLAVGSHV